MPDPIMLAIATFVFTVIGTAITTTWRVSRMLENRDRAFLKLMTDHEMADVNRFSEVHKSVALAGETLRREFGETGTAIRQKIHEMETWNRDTFLRRQSFYEATKEMASDIKNLVRAVARLDAPKHSS